MCEAPLNKEAFPNSFPHAGWIPHGNFNLEPLPLFLSSLMSCMYFKPHQLISHEYPQSTSHTRERLLIASKLVQGSGCLFRVAAISF